MIAPPVSNGVRRLDLQRKRETTALDPLTWAVHGLDVILGRLSWNRSRALLSDQGTRAAGLDYLLEEMARTTNELGAKLLVVHIPVSGEDQAPAALLKAVDRLQLPFLDLSATFREYREAARSPSLYIPDGFPQGHPSVAGHRLIADAIVSFVQQRVLLRP